MTAAGSDADPRAALPSWLDTLVGSLSVHVEEPGWVRRGRQRMADNARDAAVLILFGDGPEGPELLFIERADTLRSHPGQVAFPGGGADPGDPDSAGTALREAEEEVGLDPAGVTVFGALPTIPVPISGFEVTPVLGWWHTPGPVGVVDRAEVAAVDRVPIARLADPNNRYAMLHPRGPGGPGFLVGELLIWGVTGYLLDTVLTRGGWHRPWQQSRTMQVPERFLGAYPDGSAGPGREERAAMTADLERETMIGRFTAVLPGAEELAADLLDRYSEPHRRYHDVRHLAYVLDQIDALATDKHDLFLVRLAAWFHDAVYAIPPGQVSNEEASARLAIRTLGRYGLEQEDLGEVARLVRLTETHRPSGSDPNGELLCDADLAILAADPEAYRRYVADVREEYAQVGDEDFDRGRLEVLRQFGSRQFYRTSNGRKLTEAAQRNLTTEAHQRIDRLGIADELDPDEWPLNTR